MDQAHTATQHLLKRLLGRIYEPADVMRIISERKVGTQYVLLPYKDTAVGDECRMLLTTMAEETSKEIRNKVVESCVNWIKGL